MKCRIIKDVLDGKAGDIKEVSPSMAFLLLRLGYIEEIPAEKDKKPKEK